MNEFYVAIFLPHLSDESPAVWLDTERVRSPSDLSIQSDSELLRAYPKQYNRLNLLDVFRRSV